MWVCGAIKRAGFWLSLDLCVDKLTDDIVKVVQIRKKRMNALKGRSSFKVRCWVSLSSSVFPDFTQHKTAVTWKGIFSFRQEGMNFLLKWDWIKVSHWALLSSQKKWEYLFNMFIINMFSSVRRPNGDSHWVVKWKSSFYLFLSPFFSVTMMLQVPWGT